MVPLAVGLLAVAAVAALSSAGATERGFRPEERVLRLHDLPPGYMVGDDSGCGVGTENAPPRLAKVVVRTLPEACVFEYERRYSVSGMGPDPELVRSLALIAPDRRGAEEGVAVARELLEYELGGDLTRVPTTLSVGEDTRLFHDRDALVGGTLGHDATALLWRDGRFLAAIYAAGETEAENDAAAVRLADVQKLRLADPTPYTEAERDDTMVPIEDPNLRFPVYWLGETFRPGGSLPSSPVLYAAVSPGRPMEQIELAYSWVLLASWSRRDWRHYSRSPVGRLIWTWHCTRSERVDLPDGRAEIFAGYSKDYANCPRRPPTNYIAHAYIDQTVITVNIPIGLLGTAPEFGPFESTRGMKAVVRALRQRPTPQPPP